MKTFDHISEEQLNAFVDGELDSEESSNLFNEAAKSNQLDQRLCKQRKLKELVRHAYRDIPEPTHTPVTRGLRKGLFGMAMVASLTLVFGIITGSLAYHWLDRSLAPANNTGIADTVAVAPATNYILHVASGDPEKMRLALQEAQKLIASSEPGKQKHRVEVIANEKGLNLLRSDVTLFSKEIQALSAEDVVFYACSKSIQRLREKGVKVRLVPEAIPGFTALDRVVTRMNDGWQYIKL